MILHHGCFLAIWIARAPIPTNHTWPPPWRIARDPRHPGQRSRTRKRRLGWRNSVTRGASGKPFLGLPPEKRCQSSSREERLWVDLIQASLRLLGL